MSDKKFTLEEILEEYAPDRSKVKYSGKSVPGTPKGKLNTQKLLSEAENPDNKNSGDILNVIDSYDKKENKEENTEDNDYTDKKFEPSSKEEVDKVLEKIKQDKQKKREEENTKPLQPVKNIQPDNLLRSKISFVNSADMAEISEEDGLDGYDGIVSSGEEKSHKENGEDAPMLNATLPKIRKMEDSTRARELNRAAKKHKYGGKIKKTDNSYKYESPEGQYMEGTFDDEEKKHRQKHSGDVKHIPFSENDNILNTKDREKVSKNKKKNNKDRNKQAVKKEPTPLEKTREIGEEMRFDTLDDIDISIESMPKKKNSNKYDKTRKLTREDRRAAKRESERIEEKEREKEIELEEEEAQEETKLQISKDINSLKAVISSRVIILLLLAMLSIFISLAGHYDFPVYKSLVDMITYQGVCFLHALIGVGALFAAWSTVKYGFGRLFTFKADCDTVPSLAIILSIASAILVSFTPDLSDKGLVHIYMPVAILLLTINTFGKLLILNRASKNVDFIAKNEDWYACGIVENEYNASTLARSVVNGYPVIMKFRKTQYIADFLKYTYSSDVADNYSRISSPIYFIISLITAVITAVVRSSTMTTIESICFGVSIMTALIVIAGCAGVSLVTNIPLYDASKKLSAHDGALLGYQSIEDYYDTNSLLIDANKIFPDGSCKLAKVKIFSDIQLQENLVSAASLVDHCGSVLKDVFIHELASPDHDLYPVNDFKYEDGVGICGWIDNKRVLIGSRDMMINHHIEGLPSKSKEDSYCSKNMVPVYLAVSGNLSVLFIIEFNADKQILRSLNELQKKNIKLIVNTVDFCITNEMIKKLYNTENGFIRILPSALKKIYDSEAKEVEKASASVLSRGRLQSVSKLLADVVKIRRASKIGVTIQLISAIIGLIIGILYIFMGSFESISTQLVFLYQILVIIVTVFVEKSIKM